MGARGSARSTTPSGAAPTVRTTTTRWLGRRSAAWTGRRRRSSRCRRPKRRWLPPPRNSGPRRILVVGSTGDPATPYAWALGLASELGSGVLLTRHGDGHTAYPSSQCASDAIDRYLTVLAVPTGAGADCQS